MLRKMPSSSVSVDINAIDPMLYRLTELVSDDQQERQDWALISIPSLNRIWDNEQDAAYDDWRALYINA